VNKPTISVIVPFLNEKDESPMTVTEIRSILGIQYPMLLLDRVIAIEPQNFCHAVKNVTYNEWFFPAHYPNEPIMPGMLQIEAMTQATALTILYKPQPIKSSHTHNIQCPILLSGVDKCRFYRSITAGDSLEIFINIDRFLMGVSLATALGRVNGELVCEARISHKVTEWGGVKYVSNLYKAFCPHLYRQAG
jgi:3-hydroxyacyl-[acyl-carrier-protein] dehydratase